MQDLAKNIGKLAVKHPDLARVQDLVLGWDIVRDKFAKADVLAGELKTAQRYTCLVQDRGDNRLALCLI
jgi:hypothetical protein